MTALDDRTPLTVAITGATGAIYGVKILQRLREFDVPTTLIMSPWGRRTIEHETSFTGAQVEQMATSVENHRDLGARVSSGSVATRGMVIAPCTMKTVAAISHGLGDNLVSRAADVVLKEGRKLLVIARETPLNQVHLENMLRLARMGVIVMPPVPAFYNHPESIDDMVGYTVDRALDQFGIANPQSRRWTGEMQTSDATQDDDGATGTGSN